MSQSSSEEQKQHIVPTSPPTNFMVSVLSKMLEAHQPKPEQTQPSNDPNKKKFLFYLDFYIGKQIQKCQVQVDQGMRVQAALTQALQKFKFILTEKGYEMETGLQNYTLRLAKKNGKPKTDMPSIDLKQKFTDIKVNSSSIQIKNPNCIKLAEQVTKTFSVYHEPIGSVIGEDFGGKKQEQLTEEEMIRKQKNQNCMFSFC